MSTLTQLLVDHRFGAEVDFPPQLRGAGADSGTDSFLSYPRDVGCLRGGNGHVMAHRAWLIFISVLLK